MLYIYAFHIQYTESHQKVKLTFYKESGCCVVNKLIILCQKWSHWILRKGPLEIKTPATQSVAYGPEELASPGVC